MKALLIIVAGLYGSWYFTDLSADSGWQNQFAPVMLAVFLIALLFWLVLRGAGSKLKRGGLGDSHFFASGGDSGDDGGGDGGGSGGD